MDRANPTQVPPLRSALRIKIISVGDAAVGKSCLIKRYCEARVQTLCTRQRVVDWRVSDQP
ncbi:hypothetical protein T492DRAFT_1105522 [Pavlovales sp. CCMP2436]|nr:hypothetical protein T492DRAFT_1105522 [Pavlovales sp. CCMP2436]